MTEMSEKVFSVHHEGDRRPALITAYSLVEARMFAAYASNEMVHRRVVKVLPFRGNPCRHIGFPRSAFIRLMRMDGLRV